MIKQWLPLKAYVLPHPFPVQNELAGILYLQKLEEFDLYQYERTRREMRSPGVSFIDRVSAEEKKVDIMREDMR
jgi:hypothetical protein